MGRKQGIPKPLQPSAPKNLSPKQFVTLYRGLAGYNPKDTRTNELGKHWTTSHKVAQGFATYPHSGREVSEGVVVKARVHPDSIIKPHTDEWYSHGGMYPGSEAEQHYEAGNVMNNHIILPPDSHEQEVTVRPGSKAKIIGMTHFTEVYNEANKKKRQLKFKKQGKI